MSHQEHTPACGPGFEPETSASWIGGNTTRRVSLVLLQDLPLVSTRGPRPLETTEEGPLPPESLREMDEVAAERGQGSHGVFNLNHPSVSLRSSPLIKSQVFNLHCLSLSPSVSFNPSQSFSGCPLISLSFSLQYTGGLVQGFHPIIKCCVFHLSYRPRSDLR